MNKYPLFFKASAQSHSGIQSTWGTQSQSQSEELRMAIPAEFEGPGGGFSPEDLYVMALQNCFVATFKVFAEKSRLAYGNLRIETELALDRDGSGKPWMARCIFKVYLEECVQVENAKRILTRTSENCMILNSVNTEKVFEFYVS